jgi:hypothetical protein
MQTELFPIFPDVSWFSDETLYSLASRYHRLSGSASTAVTCQRLFGHARGGLSSDFPSRISAFATRTGGVLGDATSILHSRTIVPAYLPFLSRVDANAAVSALCGAGINTLKQTLGLARARSKAGRRMKACAACMQDDQERWGTAYWHRTHQLPATWVCVVHDEALLESTVEGTGIAQHRWHLPSPQYLRIPVEYPAPSPSTGPLKIDLLRRLAVNAQGLALLPENFEFSPEGVSKTYRIALDRLGFVSRDGTTQNVAAIGRCFSAYVAPIVGMPAFHTLARGTRGGQSQPGRYRIDPDPTNHLVLAAWLFESWGDFLSGYQSSMRIIKSEGNCT